MTKEEISKLINRLIVASDSLPEIVEDKHFLQIVDKWIDAIEDTGLCGGIEHRTLIECYKVLKKQIPMKPIMDIEPLEGGYTMYHCDCPACGMFLTGHEKGYPHHCLCGQLLDWSDENE